MLRRPQDQKHLPVTVDLKKSIADSTTIPAAKKMGAPLASSPPSPLSPAGLPYSKFRHAALAAKTGSDVAVNHLLPPASHSKSCSGFSRSLKSNIRTPLPRDFANVFSAPNNPLGPRYSKTLAVLESVPLQRKIKANIRFIDTTKTASEKKKHSLPAVTISDYSSFEGDLKNLGTSILKTLRNRTLVAEESKTVQAISTTLHGDLFNELNTQNEKKDLQKEITLVSFITSHIKKGSTTEKHCYISYSGNDKSASKSKLKSTLEKYLESKPELLGYKFFILNPSSKEFHHFLQRLATSFGIPFEMKRHCAEIAYISTLAKLFYKYGNAISIEGIANIPISTLVKKETTTEVELNAWDDKDAPIWKDYKNNDVHHWTCCDLCRNNKPLYLFLLAAIQEIGEKRIQQNHRLHEDLLSPLPAALAGLPVEATNEAKKSEIILAAAVTAFSQATEQLQIALENIPKRPSHSLTRLLQIKLLLSKNLTSLEKASSGQNTSVDFLQILKFTMDSQINLYREKLREVTSHIEELKLVVHKMNAQLKDTALSAKKSKNPGSSGKENGIKKTESQTKVVTKSQQTKSSHSPKMFKVTQPPAPNATVSSTSPNLSLVTALV